MTKYALLIGINYRGTFAALNGCINDVQDIKALIIPSFLDQFDEEIVQAVVNVPEIRDCIKECNMK